MTDGWVRATAVGAPEFGFLGAVPMILVQPGQTVLRSWWNISLFYLAADVDAYPPGNSLLRAGVVYAAEGLSLGSTPFPVSNADADWLAITSINPNVVQLSRATNVAWQINWGFPIDLSIKSQRRNDTMDDMTLYVSWEFALNTEAEEFVIEGWACSVDSLIRTPD